MTGLDMMFSAMGVGFIALMMGELVSAAKTSTQAQRVALRRSRLSASRNASHRREG